VNSDNGLAIMTGCDIWCYNRFCTHLITNYN